MTPDLTYAADVIVWALAWGALGLTARALLANGDARRHARDQARDHAGKAAR